MHHQWRGRPTSRSLDITFQLLPLKLDNQVLTVSIHSDLLLCDRVLKQLIELLLLMQEPF